MIGASERYSETVLIGSLKVVSERTANSNRLVRLTMKFLGKGLILPGRRRAWFKC